MVIVVVYHPEGHVPEMNSVLSEKERELFRSRFRLVKIILYLTTVDVTCRRSAHLQIVIRLEQAIVGV